MAVAPRRSPSSHAPETQAPWASSQPRWSGAPSSPGGGGRLRRRIVGGPRCFGSAAALSPLIPCRRGVASRRLRPSCLSLAAPVSGPGAGRRGGLGPWCSRGWVPETREARPCAATAGAGASATRRRALAPRLVDWCRLRLRRGSMGWCLGGDRGRMLALATERPASTPTLAMAIQAMPLRKGGEHTSTLQGGESTAGPGEQATLRHPHTHKHTHTHTYKHHPMRQRQHLGPSTPPPPFSRLHRRYDSGRTARARPRGRAQRQAPSAALCPVQVSSAPTPPPPPRDASWGDEERRTMGRRGAGAERCEAPAGCAHSFFFLLFSFPPPWTKRRGGRCRLTGLSAPGAGGGPRGVRAGAWASVEARA